jgi:predicted O-methyltransferase YrrM
MDFLDSQSDDESDIEQLKYPTNEDERLAMLAMRPPKCGVLEFHNGIEDSMLLFVIKNSKYGDPISVLQAIDIFCYQRHWMMHIGDMKGQYLDNAIDLAQHEDNKKITCIEFGSYCGYSAVRIASRFRNNDSVLYCVEINKKCCEWTRRLLAHAGLADKVMVIENSVENSISYFHENNIITDCLFIDHEKSKYLQDLILFEQAHLLKSGCIVIADNVLAFGTATEYLLHVRDENGPFVSSQLHRSILEYSTSSTSVENGDVHEDGVEISIYK